MADYLFILSKVIFIQSIYLELGDCELITSEGMHKKIPVEAVIGELALLNNTLRTGSIKCNSGKQLINNIKNAYSFASTRKN